MTLDPAPKDFELEAARAELRVRLAVRVRILRSLQVRVGPRDGQPPCTDPAVGRRTSFLAGTWHHV